MSLLLKQNIQPWQVLHPLLDACPSNYLIMFVWNGQALPSNPRSSKMIQSYLGFGDNWVLQKGLELQHCVWGLEYRDSQGMTWRLGKICTSMTCRVPDFGGLLLQELVMGNSAATRGTFGVFVSALESTKISGFAIVLGGGFVDIYFRENQDRNLKKSTISIGNVFPIGTRVDFQPAMLVYWNG